MIIQFPGHKLYRCGPDCEGCFACEGGLSMCTVCGGAEASLPTHCPGVEMDDVTCSSVQIGIADYKDGEWWYKGLRRREVIKITEGKDP